MCNRTTASAIVVTIATLATARVKCHVKDAIQDLYAEIREFEMAAGRGSGSSAVHLDEATSSKAKYVSDSLQRMIGDRSRGNVAGDVNKIAVAPVAGVIDEAAVHADHKRYQNQKHRATYDDAGDNDSSGGVRVDRLMQKFVELSMGKTRKNAKMKTKATGSTPSLMHADAMERRFSDLFELFIRPSTTVSVPATIATAHEYCRHKAPPPVHRPGGIGGGLFKFHKMFNKQWLHVYASRIHRARKYYPVLFL